ncbi:MAG: flagellin [Rhizomicrobium sp.]
MSFSVNTNSGALVALQYLNATQSQLTTTQNAINSGLKVASAKDDGSTYAIAQNQRGSVAGYSAVTDSLNRGSSAIDVALSAGQSISDLLIQLKTKGARRRGLLAGHPPAARPSIRTSSPCATRSRPS